MPMKMDYTLKTDQVNGMPVVWDIVRKKWVKLTGEEHVRQQVIHYLIHEKGIARGHIGVEKGISYHKMPKRFDIVVFDRSAQPWILCECKGPNVAIGDNTLQQVARYNVFLKAPNLLLTNGLQWLFFTLDEKGKYQFCENGWIPEG